MSNLLVHNTVLLDEKKEKANKKAENKALRAELQRAIAHGGTFKKSNTRHVDVLPTVGKSSSFAVGKKYKYVSGVGDGVGHLRGVQALMLA